ncbi:MAG TPA: HigA family addiction module antitoxin [Devosia sp.]|jgi:addiction module HigA family antidote|nr:HigA family addiction module antitoxin [Devosia sp.]
MPARVLPPVHPGEYLSEEYLAPLGLTPYALAVHLGVPRTRIERLCRQQTGITPDTALRLARYFGTTPDFWMTLQALHDLTVAEQQSAKTIAAIKPMRAA